MSIDDLIEKILDRDPPFPEFWDIEKVLKEAYEIGKEEEQGKLMNARLFDRRVLMASDSEDFKAWARENDPFKGR